MYSEALWELMKVFLAALLASTLTHLLTHRRFIQGRWWDRKADAYSSIIGALVAMKRSLLHPVELVVMAGQMAERSGEDVWTEGLAKRMIEFASEFRKARDQIERTSTEGDYIISGKVSEALEELLGKFPPYRKLPGDIEGVAGARELVDWVRDTLEALTSCLEVVRAEARSDLRVKWYS